MKKTFFSAIFLSLFFAAFLGAPTIYAANPSAYILPATGSRNIGTAFNVSVNVAPDGANVCVVKGTINFSNLSCQAISVAAGLSAQTSPTCANPNFTLGIPKCATDSKALFTITAKGQGAGVATVSLSGVKIIGAGNILSDLSTGGTYNIVAVAGGQTQVQASEYQLTSPADLNAENATPTENAAGNQEQTMGLSASPAAKSLMASIGDSLASRTAIWIIVIFLALVAGYFLVKKFPKKPKE